MFQHKLGPRWPGEQPGEKPSEAPQNVQGNNGPIQQVLQEDHCGI